MLMMLMLSRDMNKKKPPSSTSIKSLSDTNTDNEQQELVLCVCVCVKENGGIEFSEVLLFLCSGQNREFPRTFDGSLYAAFSMLYAMLKGKWWKMQPKPIELNKGRCVNLPAFLCRQQNSSIEHKT